MTHPSLEASTQPTLSGEHIAREGDLREEELRLELPPRVLQLVEELLRDDGVRLGGGFRIGDGFISPLDLVGIGLVSAEEAQELHDLETAGAAS